MNENKREINHKHYTRITYDSKWRFISYWHQINEALSCNPKHILEIGIGSGFVSQYLKRAGINVTTCDINPDLHPDIIASATSLPFNDGAFDTVTAYEVLEHLPYSETQKALLELARVSSHFIIISLPEATPFLRFDITIPKIGRLKKLISFGIFSKIHVIHGQDPHQWEIGKKGYQLTRLIVDMRAAGLFIKKTYRVFEYPRHRFFILEKVRN